MNNIFTPTVLIATSVGVAVGIIGTVIYNSAEKKAYLAAAEAKLKEFESRLAVAAEARRAA